MVYIVNLKLCCLIYFCITYDKVGIERLVLDGEIASFHSECRSYKGYRVVFTCCWGTKGDSGIILRGVVVLQYIR